MNSTTFRAMGTRIEAWFEDGDRSHHLEEWFECAEQAFSRFRPDSELSVLNDGGHGARSVSPMMRQVLAEADWAREATAGLVDVGVGRAVVDWGYDRTFDDVRDLSHAPAPSEAPRWQIEGDLVELANGTTLDLGGIAKGWTCDRAVELGLGSVVSAGGDLRSSDPATRAMIVDPWGTKVSHIHVGEGALATSSVMKRRWRVGDREVSHLINPLTMAPSLGPVLSATVVARTAVEAEVGAKAVLLHGVDGLAWAEEQTWIKSALVIWHDGSVFATTGTRFAA